MFSPGGVLSPGYVTVEDGLIVAVSAGSPPRRPDIQLDSGVLIPGLVDLQVNGYRGDDLAEAGPAGWARVVQALPETGTTAFLPTLITAPAQRLCTALREAVAFTPALPAGARVLGVHMEGPFIAVAKAGAHRRDWITAPDPATITSLLAAGARLLRLVTLAPEVPGGLAAVTAFTGAGVAVSVGHSDATARQVSAAADAGATMVTHLFNAQRGLAHREPGVAGQALADPRLTSGLIVDGQHVALPVCGIAARAAPGRICLVTDATAAAGMPPGRYVLGGEPVDLPPGEGAAPVRLDGTLAGSALRLDTAVGNAAGLGMGLVAAVEAATWIPARLIGRPDLGRLAPGAAADLAWLGDDLRARATWVGGQQVFG